MALLLAATLLTQASLAMTSPSVLISVNQIQLIRLSLQHWNQKIPGLNLSVRSGVDVNSPRVQAALDREFLLMQFWYEGAVQTLPQEFHYLVAHPAVDMDEKLRANVCNGISCGGSGSGSACSPAC